MDKLLYKSTRGQDKLVTASEAIIRGIAEDGGLFVPTAIPEYKFDFNKLVNMNYKEIAFEVMKLFLTDFHEAELKECIEKAYDEKFDIEEIAPLVFKNGAYFLELYHGATLAFKDMALSILPYLLKVAAKKVNLEKEIVILTATSGDTGKAALEGFANVEGTKIVVYFPEYGVSEIQKKQMVTQGGNNTYVIGIDGNFDDAQNGVKRMFTDKELLAKLDSKNYVFSSANSINIGRLIPQVAYYFYAYLQLCKKGAIKPGDSINFTVPTGNFGNILAGYYAKEMGLPINKLICASNENKVLYDFIKTGIYDKNREFKITMSPSMDILISSNLERLLYIISGDDSNIIRALMGDLNKCGKYQISNTMKSKFKDFYAEYTTEESTAKAIKEVFEGSDYIIDTHTAVAYYASKKYKEYSGDDRANVIVSTASPYKFTNDVMKAIDSKYAGKSDFELVDEMSLLVKEEIPVPIRNIEKRPRIHNVICNKEEMQKELEKILNI